MTANCEHQNAVKTAKRTARFGGLVAIAFAFAALWPISLRAGTVWEAVEAEHIKWTNATTNWVDGDLVITYQTGSGTLHLPGYAKVWALAVGGGGSGGASKPTTTATPTKMAGAGAGGGAGGYVENMAMMLKGGEGSEGDYEITVGAGAAAMPTTAEAPGLNGEDSSIRYQSNVLDGFPEAVGGGGGGAQTVGSDGGSGGGGSIKRYSNYLGLECSGGNSSPGLGHAGGVGIANLQWIAAGGGGAGTNGCDTSGTTSGDGGDGKESLITGSSVWYAGGGGGSIIKEVDGYTAGAGGKGGGGHGGDGTAATQALVNGEDGKGGGGGGGSVAGPSGKGGDGVVIIRISMVIDGPIDKPTSQDFDYDGTKKIAAFNIPNVYSLSGTNEATNVGTYTYTATLEQQGTTWSDGSSDPVTVTWHILPGRVEMPVPPTGLVYAETNAVAAKSSAQVEFVDPSTTEAMDKGDYQYTARLKDPTNYRWSDGSTTNLTYSWSIAPRVVQLPALPQGLVYSGTNNVAVTNNEHFYTFSSDSKTEAVDAGTYKITFKLTDPANNVWPDGSTADQTRYWTIARQPIAKPPLPGDNGHFVYDGSYKVAVTNSVYWLLQDEYRRRDAGKYEVNVVLNNNYCWTPDIEDVYHFTWYIDPAPNAISSVTLHNWKFGEKPRTGEPFVSATWGATTAKYSYGPTAGGPWTETQPTNMGVYYVRAEVPVAQNWKGAVATKRFLIYKSFDELYTDFVDINFPSYAGDVAKEPVVLIKISPEIFPGFDYARCGGSENLAFMDLTDDGSVDPSPLSYEVDTWNEAGESYVWVRLQQLKRGATTIRMYWHLRDGFDGPGADPAGVWNGYAGVWHFSETINGDAAAATPSADATGNGYAAYPRRLSGQAERLSEMTSAEGQIGKARNNSTTATTGGGNHLIVTNFANCALGAKFIFSGWVRVKQFAAATQNGSPWLVSRNQANGDAGGFALALDATATPTKLLAIDGEGGQTSVGAIGTAVNTWVHLTYAVDGDDYWALSHSANGAFSYQGSLANPVGEEALPLTFGNDHAGRKASLCGRVDEFRIRPWPAGWTLAAVSNDAALAYANAAAPTEFVRHDYVTVDGLKQNFWITLPHLTKTEWEEGSPEPGTVDFGEAATGQVSYVCTRIFNEGYAITNALPTAGAIYEITYTVRVDGFDDLTHRERFSITAKAAYNALGQTEEGRVLLANDDSQGDWGDTSVTNQAYWIEHYLPYTCSSNYVTQKYIGGRWVYITNWVYWTEYKTNTTYWTHWGDSAAATALRPYILTNSYHTLETTNKIESLCGSSLLWRLENVIIGNLHSQDESEYYIGQNFLPWSPTSLPISSNGVEMARSEVGNLILRNTTGACIYSPCYTNGIGTIYFDAVNAYTAVAGESCQIVVEVATNVIVEAEGEEQDADEEVRREVIIPTDANVREEREGETNLYGRADWFRVPMTPLVVQGGSTTKADPTEVLKLDMKSGGSTSSFYRIYVPLNFTVPARFRIRRSAALSGYAIDGNAFILMDNLIVSKPHARADIDAFGFYDATKRGKQVLGQQGGTSVPFPSVRDTDIRGRARARFTSAEGSDTDSFVRAVTMHYQWRYLNQHHAAFSGWKAIDMRRLGDLIETTGPIEHPGLPGDVEYWFETDLQAPFYAYVDYSGLGRGLNGADGKPLYSEELKEVVNHFSDTEEYRDLHGTTLPSMGQDWFFRLREGKSDIERMVLRIEGRADIDMELIADHIWRGYFKTVDGISGGVRYRIEPRNVQDPQDLGYAINTNFWYARDDVERMPVSAVLRTDGTTNSWSRIPCDGYTGYLMFQADDATKSISIVHADYCDFDQWHDAWTNGLYFTGNSTEDGKKSGFSPRMREYAESFLFKTNAAAANPVPWTATPATNTDWRETFTDTGAQWEYPLYETFGSSTSINGWRMGPGQRIYQWYRSPVEDAGGHEMWALQMEGCGKGYIQFPLEPYPVPRGMGTISFQARLAQFINMDDDISYAEFPEGDRAVSKDYTFLALCAFDVNGNEDFSGNASLSLFGYYRPRNGGYELRLEQVGGDSSGPSNVRKLTLYRWNVTSGGTTIAELGSRHIEIAPVATLTHKGKFLPVYLSCQTLTDETVIKAGLLKDAKGFAYNGEMVELNSKQFLSVVYRDTASNRLKRGTYGVLSTNCKGVFQRPHISPSAVITAKTERNKMLVDDNDDKTPVGFGAFSSCRDDIVDPNVLDKPREDCWNVNFSRMEIFMEYGDNDQWGIRAAPVKQSVVVQIAPRGTTDRWTTVDWFKFDSFGAKGSSGKLCTTRIDRTSDLDMRICVEGHVDDARTDVVIDELEVTQWRGCDYGDDDTSAFIAPGADWGWRTNFTFSSAIVTNYVSGGSPCATVILSAKRTAGQGEVNTAVSGIRSPLMDGSGTPARGIGLGMFAFSYRNAQENAKLLVQIATNGISQSSALGWNTVDPAKWTTVKEIDFRAGGEYATNRVSGIVSVYLGLHGVAGLMRVVVDPEVVKEVSPTNWLDASRYGEVEITHVMCRDEPPIDLESWWGWNLQTTDHADRQYLTDYLRYDSANGLSLGLNNSLDEGINPEDRETYRQWMPFVQTPSFVSNTVGEIAFRARKYGLNDAPNAEITLWGGTFQAGTTNLIWKMGKTSQPLARFVISNTTFTTYTYKTKPGEGYKAFRLGVSGVKDVVEDHSGPPRPDGKAPTRVVIDEVLVSEAIRPEVGFRYCYPIRSLMAETVAVTSVFAREEQPIMGDAWSVQAEIEVKLLPDEVDLVTHKPRVLFHWYSGDSPWGYEAWKNHKDAKTAELALADDETMVFRGSYISAPKAVVGAEPANATYTYRIYQYSADVIYYDNKGNCITGALSAAEWKRPAWYAPLDLNATKGDATHFAGYNVLESVSPGRAWINEVNVFDGKDASYKYTAADKQYIEIAVPFNQSLRNWRIELIDNTFKTSNLCIFGMNKVASAKTVNATNNYVFLTVQSPATAAAKTYSAAKGEVDGNWNTLGGKDTAGELDQVHPIGLRLLRPSGIVAHQIALEGTNTWAGTDWYESRYSPARLAENLNAADPEKLWYVAGNEFGGTEDQSLGVTKLVTDAPVTAVTPRESWTHDMVKTPGSVNEGQEIPDGYAIFPNGDMIIINATIVGPHVRHTVGDVTNDTIAAMVATKKPEPGQESAGTNITYHLDTWYEIDTITENNVVKSRGGGDGFVFAAGRNASDSVITVIARARPRADLREKYGLTDDNPYTDAVMHWLNGGRTMKGEFAYRGSIDLPVFRDLQGNFITNLTLTEAYWLDIDPTGSNWCYKAGICAEPKPVETHFTRDEAGNLHYTTGEYWDVAKTNWQMGVEMVITNESPSGAQKGLNWSPYVLQGKGPGENSQKYASRETTKWDSVTFKMTGDIQNNMPLRVKWVPLRYFVFTEGSFDARNRSVVEVSDPYSSYSLGVNYGWMNYKGCPVFYRWSIDQRLAPVAIEVLAPTNSITW